MRADVHAEFISDSHAPQQPCKTMLSPAQSPYVMEGLRIDGIVAVTSKDAARGERNIPSHGHQDA